MKTLEYSSRRLARRISQLMKKSTNLAESTPAKDVRIKEGNRQPVLLAQQVITVLNTRYDFRYNLLTEELSFVPTVAATSLFDI